MKAGKGRRSLAPFRDPEADLVGASLLANLLSQPFLPFRE